MKLSLEETSKILSISQDEVLFIVQDGRLPVQKTEDKELKYLADGRVEFTDQTVDKLEWNFLLDDVLKVKQEIEEGVAGQLQTLLG